MAEEQAICLQVCIRCRPFASKDKLGVVIYNGKEGEGDEVELISEDGERFGRWGFSKAWWSAYGYEKFTDEESIQTIKTAGLKTINQEDVYNQVGAKMKRQFLDGNAVVMFAYGLSGSGKTYSVFGPDMINTPEAWFNFETPHRDWGVFPRLAYDIITNEQVRSPGQWEISLKYFQNVVDRILDLLSGQEPNDPRKKDKESSFRNRRSSVRNMRAPNNNKTGMVDGVEDRHINEGFHVDAHGFVDITWCRRHLIKSWTELTSTFKKANGKKAISPTQFNHASTRGHCILVFEAKMPHPSLSGVSRCGRLYVCDLAGAEPAAEVHCAQYARSVDSDGHVHYEYRGKDPDRKKTDELVRQGKKINLSLSEMTGFFRQMAKLIKQKKFNPDRPIPGCRTYFLGKFLKNTLMHARTYLFAAIRPELQYQTFTESTLEFANHASVVKLRPRRMDSHQVDHDALTGDARFDQLLFTVENKPESLHEKMQLLHDSTSGRRPLSALQEEQCLHIVDQASDFLPEATCIGLKRLIQSESSNDLCAGAVLDVLCKCVFANGATGNTGGSSTTDTSANRKSRNNSIVGVSSSLLEQKTKEMSTMYSSNDFKLIERANYITTLDQAANEMAEAHSKSMNDRIRRGSSVTLNRKSSEVMFDTDHRNTSIAHAVMLCSSKRAFQLVVERKEMPPTVDDDILFEEAGLSGNVYLSMVIHILSQAVDTRVAFQHNTASSEQLEAEIARADELQTTLTQENDKYQSLMNKNETMEIEWSATQLQAKEFKTQLEQTNKTLETEQAKHQLIIEQKLAVETDNKTLQHENNDIKLKSEEMKHKLEQTNKTLDETEHVLKDNIHALNIKTDELNAVKEQLNQRSREVSNSDVALEEAEKLRSEQERTFQNQLESLRIEIKRMQNKEKNTIATHRDEMKTVRAAFKKEKDITHAMTSKLKGDIAKFAARTWKSNAQSKKMVRHKDNKLELANHNNKELQESLEIMVQSQEHALKLAHTQNERDVATIDLMKHHNSEIEHQLDALKIEHSELNNKQRLDLAKTEHTQRALEFQLQEQQASTERSLELERIRNEEMLSDRDAAEKELETSMTTISSLKHEIELLQVSQSNSVHTSTVEIAEAQAKSLKANEETKAAQRRLASLELQLGKMSDAKNNQEEKNEEQRKRIVQLEYSLTEMDAGSRTAKVQLALRRASCISKKEEEELKQSLLKDENEIVKLQSVLTETRDQSQKWEILYKQTKVELENTSSQLQESKNVVATSTTKYNIESSTMDQLQVRCEELENTCTIATRKLAVQSAEMDTTREALKETESKYRQTKTVADSQKNKCQEWEIKYQQALRKIANTEEELKEESRSTEESKETLHQSVLMLEKQLDTAESARQKQIAMVQEAANASEKQSRATIAALREDIKNERETLRKARTELNQDRLEELDTHRQLEEEINHLKLTLGEKESSLNLAKREQESAKQENKNIHQELNGNSGLFKQLQERLDESRSTISAMRKENRQTTAKHVDVLTELRTKCDSAVHKADSLAVELDQEKKTKSQTREQLDETKEQLRLLKDEARKIATRMNNSEQTRKTSDASMKAMEEELTCLRTKGNKVSAKVREQMSRGAKALTNYESKRKELVKAEAKIVALQAQIEDMKESASNKKVKKLKIRIRDAKRAAEEAQESAQTAIDVATGHRETIAHHKDQHEKALETTKKAKSDASVARKALQGQRNKLAAAKIQINELEEQILKLKQKHADKVDKMQDKHGQMRNKLLVHQKEFADAKNMLEGDEAWQEVTRLKKEIIAHKSQQMMLEIQNDEHNTDKDVVKQSHAKLVEQYEQEIQSLRKKMNDHENRSRSDKLEEQQTIAVLKKEISNIKISNSGVQLEKNTLQRRLDNEIESRKHDVSNMLHATEHALKHVLNATKDNKDIKAATTNAAARADSGINVIAATETNLDSMLVIHQGMCEKAAKVQRQQAEELSLVHEQIESFKRKVQNAHEEMETLRLEIRRLRKSQETTNQQCMRLTEEKQASLAETAQIKVSFNAATLEHEQKEVRSEQTLQEYEMFQIAHKKEIIKMTEEKNNQDRTQQTLIHSMTIDLKKSKDRISSLETKLNAAETVKASMERELSTANQTLDKNIHQRDVLLRDLDHSKEDIAANKRNTKTENQRLNKQIKELREEVSSTSQELTAERARVSERRSEIREVTQKMEAVSRASEAYQDDIQANRIELSDCKKEIEEKRQELRKHISSGDALEREHRNALNRVVKEARVLEREYKRLSEKHSRKENELVAFEKELEESKNNNVLLKDEIQTINDQLEETISNATNALVERVEELEQHQQELVGEYEHVKSICKEYNEKNIELELERNKLQEALETSETINESIQVALERTKSELSISKTTIVNVERSTRKLEADRDRITDTLDEVRQQNDRERQEYATLYEQKVGPLEEELERMTMQMDTVETNSMKLRETVVALEDEKNKIAGLGSLERNSLVSELQRLKEDHHVVLTTVELKHSNLTQTHDSVVKEKADLETINARQRIELERLERENKAYIEVDGHQKTMVTKLSADLSETRKKLHDQSVETNSALASTQQQLLIATHDNKEYASQLKIMSEEMNKTNNEVETTRTRLDQFRESYRKAQTYLNTSNFKIESLTQQLEATETALLETKQDAEFTESHLRTSLSDAENKVQLLEPEVRKSRLALEHKEEQDFRVREIEDELNQELDMKIMLEKTLSMLQGNEKNHIASINHCQSMFDAVHREEARTARLKAEAKLRKPKRHGGPGGGGGASTPRKTRLARSPQTPLMTPTSQGYAGDATHVHTPGSGHRHCSTCESKREELETEIALIADEKGIGGTGNSNSKNKSSSSKRRKRRKPITLVNRTQRVAIELSAAIQLLERTLERWMQERQSSRNGKRSR